MKVAALSDLHLDENNRFDETSELMDWMVTDIAEYEPGLITVAGDSSPVSVRPSTPKERMKLSSFYQALAQIAPVIVIRGNHDVSDGDVDIYSRLQSKNQIVTFSSPNVICDGLNATHVIVAAVPWPSKQYLLTTLADRLPSSRAELDESCRRSMRDVLHGLGARIHDCRRRHPDWPAVLVAHLNVAGSDAGGFRLIGTDVEVTQEDLEAVGADIVLLGHIHKHQSFGPYVWYSGSPRRVDHGEETETKGYIQATIGVGVEPQVMLRPTSIPPMQTIIIDVPAATAATVIDGADVRVIVNVNEEDRSTFDEPEMRKAVGDKRALRFKVEYRVVPKQRVRAAHIREAKTDADRLMVHLQTLDPPLGASAIERLMVKLRAMLAS